MTRTLTFLLLLSQFSCSSKSNRIEEQKQVLPEHVEYHVGESIKQLGDQAEYRTTNTVSSPVVEFKEMSFTLKVSRDDLSKAIDSLISDLDNPHDEHFKKILSISASYLKSDNDLVFNGIWARAEEFNDTSWEEAAKIGDRWATSLLLKELACNLIEKGKVQITENGEEQQGYYQTVVLTDYGYSKGVVTKSKQLIWICPPYVVY